MLCAGAMIAQQVGAKATRDALFLSSGELTPFVLELRAGRLPVHYRAEGKITGGIEMKRLGSS